MSSIAYTQRGGSRCLRLGTCTAMRVSLKTTPSSLVFFLLQNTAGPSSAPTTGVEVYIYCQLGLPETSDSTSPNLSSGPTENNVTSAVSWLQNHFRYRDSNPGILRERQVCWPPTSYRSRENPLLTQPEKNRSAEHATSPSGKVSQPIPRAKQSSLTWG